MLVKSEVEMFKLASKSIDRESVSFFKEVMLLFSIASRQRSKDGKGRHVSWGAGNAGLNRPLQIAMVI